MTYTVSITSQGQLSLPAKVRQELGFNKLSKALLSVENGKVTLEPVIDLMSLRGSAKPSASRKKVSSQDLHAAFEADLAKGSKK